MLAHRVMETAKKKWGSPNSSDDAPHVQSVPTARAVRIPMGKKAKRGRDNASGEPSGKRATTLRMASREKKSVMLVMSCNC